MVAPSAIGYREVSREGRPRPERVAPSRLVAAGQRFYRPELDVLRFFAFLAVFLFHLAENLFPYSFFSEGTASLGMHRVAVGLINMGTLGVDLFFVLSSYLITSLLLREREVAGTVDVGRFYGRRILRIWPLYFGFLVVSVLVASQFPGYRLKGLWLLSFFFLLGNFATPLIIAHRLAINQIIGPLWSISVEEQFYLTWPHVMKYASRRWMIRACAVMLFVSAVARVTAPFTHIRDVYFNTFARLDPIAIGILIAVGLYPRLPDLRAWVRILVCCGGIALWIVASVCCGIRMSHIPTYDCVVGYLLAAMGCGAILVAVLGIRAHGETRWWKTLVYLGQISYGLYVFHSMILTVARHLIAPQHFAGAAMFAAVSLAATIAVAAASYRFYETPFLRLKSRLAYVPSRPV